MIVVLLMLLRYMYIKLYFPFWNTIQVSHSYTWNILATLGILQNQKPYVTFVSRSNNNTNHYDTKHKFYDSSIVTCSWENSPKHLLSNFLQLHGQRYNDDSILCTVNQAILQHYSNVCSISSASTFCEEGSIVSYRKYFTEDVTTGFVYARPCECFIRIQFANKLVSTSLPTMFIEYICDTKKDEKYRDRNTSSSWHSLLYTHLQHQTSFLNNVQHITLLKSSSLSDTRGIIPIVIYTSSLYRIVDIIPKRMVVLPPTTTCEICNSPNEMTYMKSYATKRYEFVVLTHAPIFLNHEHDENHAREMMIYCLRTRNTLQGFYVFKNTHTHYESFADGNTIRLVASMNLQKEKYLGVFIMGFYSALQQIVRKQAFVLLQIDALSDNLYIIDDIHKQSLSSTLATIEESYYAINVIHQTPYNASDIFIAL